MKTTIEIPDDLFMEAKATAARRRTTLKAMMEHALRREIAGPVDLPPDGPYEIGPFGILSLKKKPGSSMTAAQVQQLIDHQYDEEDEKVLNLFKQP
jgi:hypothetical protein